MKILGRTQMIPDCSIEVAGESLRFLREIGA